MADKTSRVVNNEIIGSYNITTEDELKQALIRLLGDVSITVTPPMVAAAMGEALAAFLEEEMS